MSGCSTNFAARGNGNLNAGLLCRDDAGGVARQSCPIKTLPKSMIE
jgi:hypothetical protein